MEKEKKEKYLEEKILNAVIKFSACWFLFCHLFVWKDSGKWSEEELQQYSYCSDSEKEEREEKKQEWGKVCVTVYNPVMEQCDSTPLITADNSEIDLAELKKGNLKWVAVSRDLLKNGVVKYGDKVRINCKEDPTLSGIYTVHDTMHPRWKKHIDILAHQEVRTTGKYNEVEVYYLD